MTEETRGIGAWLRTHLPDGAVIIIVSMIAGAIAGLCAFGLHKGIALLGGLLSSPLRLDGGNWLFLVYAVVAFLGAVIFQKSIKQNLADSTVQIKIRLSERRYRFPLSYIFTPLLGCLITIGFGASAGAEGPCAFSGAVIGDRVSRLFRLSPAATRLIFVCGAAAGIAGIFKSPVGGLFFAVEVLRIELTVLGFVAVAFACLSAFGVAYVLSGYTWNLTITTDMPFIPDNFGWMALLGLVCGIYSIYYSYTYSLGSRFMQSLKNIWIRSLICGLGMGVIIFMFPAMFGEGYDIVSNILNGIYFKLVGYGPFNSDLTNFPVILIIVLCMLLVKGLVVGSAASGGGIVGEFVPTVFAGALMGFLFASIANYSGLNLEVANFTLLGTAAVMAGAIKAPLMAIFIAAEVSAHYDFILGFMLCAGVSFAVVKIFDIYVARRNAK